MKRTEVLNGVRMLKFWDVFGRWEKGRLSELEAAELLGVTERTFRRWRRRYGEEGEGGLVDRRLASHRRSGCQRRKRNGSGSSTGSATRASRPSTSTSMPWLSTG